MAIQMAEYVTHAVLRYYRRFDEYERLAREKKWEMLDPFKRQDFTIGIMGMGVMGTAVAQPLSPFGFPGPDAGAATRKDRFRSMFSWRQSAEAF